jgi:cytochrome c550
MLVLALTAFVVAGCSGGGSEKGTQNEGVKSESNTTAEKAGAGGEKSPISEQEKAQESSVRDVKDPQQLFIDNCGPCHGHDGTGLVGPSIKATDLSTVQVKDVTDNGKGSGMPKFKGGELSDDQIAAIAQYVKDKLK